MNKFYTWSDLHTELLSLQQTKKLCKKLFHYNKNANLLLAGDIGKPGDRKYKYVLTWVTRRYNKIFIIAGNHELYYSNKQDAHVLLQNMCRSYTNVYFLDQSIYIDPDYILFGCTLWTCINIMEKPLVEQVYNDFKYIENVNINEWHTQDVNWLKTMLQYYKDDDRTKIIMTHHMPSYKLIHPYYLKTSRINSAFANTDCNELSANYWIYGHTHMGNKTIMNKCTYICNPIGYKDENLNYTIQIFKF